MASAIIISIIVIMYNVKSTLMMSFMHVIGFMLGPMLSVGGLSLLAPLTLLGLLALPIIWWVMRITPPKPRRQIFPPLRILQDVETRAQTPDKTPIWLLLFRLLFSAIIIFGLAKPVFQAQESIQHYLL